MNSSISPGKKIYFISDFHLGVPNYEKSLEREKRVVKWLNEVKENAAEIYFLGDVFDFWFEYKTVVPKGYVRLLGKIAELSDIGIKIHYFTGNHDMWCFDYFPKELGVTLYKHPVEREVNGVKFFIGHGDGLGLGDKGYKLLKKIFSNRFCQWLFARLHPNFGIGLANYFSKTSRVANGTSDEQFLGENKEWLLQYCKGLLTEGKNTNYFIFGHRHLPLDIKINNTSRYINLGEWINYNSYAVFDGEKVELKYFK